MASPEGSAREEATLCARYEARLRLYGRRHLGDASRAADLAQRVLLVTVEGLRAGRVRDAERVGSFMLGTARRVALQLAREGSRARPEAGLEAAAWEAPAGERVRDPLALRLLARCLEALGHRERAVVVLTFYEEASAAEVAGQLALTEGNARVIRHRAVGHLRACMEGGGGPP